MRGAIAVVLSFFDFFGAAADFFLLERRAGIGAVVLLVFFSIISAK